jgi:ribosomal protein L22
MTPANPQDPQKGKVDETTGKLAEEAKQAKQATDAEAAEQPEPKPKAKRTRAKKATAADETGAGKAAADAVARDAEAGDADTETAEPPAKPKRTRTRARKADESEPAAPEEKAKEPAPTRRRDRRPAAEPGVLVRAQARYVRTSARKARLVCDHIRGKDVTEARAILAFTPRAAAKPWLKLLESAVANAEHNHELVGEDLRIAAVHADEGPTLKRFRPRAMGRATRIRKRTSHLTITLTPKES